MTASQHNGAFTFLGPERDSCSGATQHNGTFAFLGPGNARFTLQGSEEKFRFQGPDREGFTCPGTQTTANSHCRAPAPVGKGVSERG
ncbi:unnamed protein product [Lampetra planeri]